MVLLIRKWYRCNSYPAFVFVRRKSYCRNYHLTSRFFSSSISALLGLSNTSGNLVAAGLNLFFSFVSVVYQITVAICLLLRLEQINWHNQLPNSVEAELAPYFWIWKVDYPNAKSALRKFEGLINCFVNYRNNIPIMNDLIFQYLDHLSEMAPENKSAAFSLCYIYYSCINGIEVAAKDKMKMIIEKNIDLLNKCNTYNIITAFFVGEIPDNADWETTDFLQAVEKYRKNKYRKSSIKLPKAIELLLYLTLANSYKDDNNLVQQKVWLDIAYHNANNDGEIQKQIRNCIESHDMFSTGII